MERSSGGLTVSVVVRVTPLKEAERVATLFEATGVVAMAKLTVVAPPGTVTVEGTPAKPESELRGTGKPAAGAGEPRCSVPVELTPPTTTVGVRVIERSSGGLTVSVVVRVTPLKVAEIVAVELAATGIVEIEKVATVAPPGTVTVAGTVT
jgi:hypothetical protein